MTTEDTPKHDPTSASLEKDIMIGKVMTDTSFGEGEKNGLSGHADYHGIDTSQVQPGADAAYEAKIVVMNEALIDIGMNSFQWKIYAMTGFGWFVDNVSLCLRISLSIFIFD